MKEIINYLDCVHDWELFVAEKTMYHFCRMCKATLYDGRVYPFRDKEIKS